MGIAVYQRQRKVPCDLTWLRGFSLVAEPAVRAITERAGGVLAGLAEVEVVLVSDAAISRVHREFMNLPEPTDVITFHHGEIVISVETAARQAADFQRSLEEELALYVVHGLLHLHGYLDKTKRDFERMRSTQERLLTQCLAAWPLKELRTRAGVESPKSAA